MNLLDTHVLPWWLQERAALSVGQERILEAASEDQPVGLSCISLWEIAMLSAKGRIRLQVPLPLFLDAIERSSLVRVLPISAAVAAKVAELPPHFHGDPADRLIVSTAIVHNATLLTADRPIIDSGMVPVCS